MIIFIGNRPAASLLKITVLRLGKKKSMPDMRIAQRHPFLVEQKWLWSVICILLFSSTMKQANCNQLLPMHMMNNNNNYEQQTSSRSTHAHDYSTATPSLHSSTASTALYDEDDLEFKRRDSTILVWFFRILWPLNSKTGAPEPTKNIFDRITWHLSIALVLQ